MLPQNEDTIAAVSTAQGQSAIAVIRISGNNAAQIITQLIGSDKPKKQPRTAFVGWISDEKTLRKIDKVVAIFFKGPSSFTGEDLVEIYCHGGPLIVRFLMSQILSKGARFADRGEFSKRAFLNGKIDLIQAEAIVEAIRSKTLFGLSSAMGRVDGKLSKEISEIKIALENVLSAIVASTDFPEDVDEPDKTSLTKTLESIAETCDKLIADSRTGMLLNDGIRVLILGKPNAGKSSLLNSMLKEERAIVTEIPGTTTDAIETTLNIDGMPFILVDTAGIRDPQNPIETEGIKRALEKIATTDIILAVFDASAPCSSEDERIISEIRDFPNKIAVMNKSDKPLMFDTGKIKSIFNKQVQTIAIQEKGINELESALLDMAREEADPNIAGACLGNERQTSLVAAALNSIKLAQDTLQAGHPIDIVAQDIAEAISTISEMSGLEVSDRVIEMIFSEFCVGK
jgi:tRNA modification GTPase